MDLNVCFFVLTALILNKTYQVKSLTQLKKRRHLDANDITKNNENTGKNEYSIYIYNFGNSNNGMQDFAQNFDQNYAENDNQNYEENNNENPFELNDLEDLFNDDPMDTVNFDETVDDLGQGSIENGLENNVEVNPEEGDSIVEQYLENIVEPNVIPGLNENEFADDEENPVLDEIGQTPNDDIDYENMNDTDLVDYPQPNLDDAYVDSIYDTNPNELDEETSPPEKNPNKAVYGNLANLGITYGKTPNRLSYSNFRKSPILISDINKALKSFSQKKNPHIDRRHYESNSKSSERLDVFVKDSNENHENLFNPGFSLIQPTADMLLSAAKYPSNDLGKRVYGNTNNVGVTYGKTPTRIMYTSFRKTNDLVKTILNAVRELKYSKNSQAAIIIRNESHKSKRKQEPNADDRSIARRDDSRATHHRNRDKKYSQELKSAEEDSSDDSSDGKSDDDYERNPGNPYTIHKEKYKQNYLWNHFMDGDHMNIYPSAPKFSSLGPSGADLIFGRKWWYFNQDDYVPFG